MLKKFGLLMIYYDFYFSDVVVFWQLEFFFFEKMFYSKKVRIIMDEFFKVQEYNILSFDLGI